jgi:hypothetical protein
MHTTCLVGGCVSLLGVCVPAEYLDGGAGCTPNLRNASQIADMEQAIADGDVVWNAMPFRCEAGGGGGEDTTVQQSLWW